MLRGYGFIPNRDGEFSGFANTFLSKVQPDAAAYGLTPEELTALQAEVAEWDTKYSQMMARHDEAKGATVAKDNARQTLTQTLRMLARKIQGDPAVTDQMKAIAGLPIHSTTRTPSPVPTTSPLAEIDSCEVQRQTIRFSDSLNPNARSRPRGVFGVEIYTFVGETAPLDNDQFVMNTIATRMKAMIDFTNEEAGKTAFYRFRYINRVGEVGPWSQVFSSMIMK